ncbi:MAG: NfeD family protein [Candidatus Saliniplasma sp.]
MDSLGLILVVIGILLLIIEVAEPGFFLAIPGGVLLVLGIIGLAYPALLTTIWAPLIVAVVVTPLMVISIKFYQSLSPPTKPTTTMSSSLKGKTGKVVKTIQPEEIKGKIRVDNQIWSATADDVIEEGKKVEVVEGRGVHLLVKEVEE